MRRSTHRPHRIARTRIAAALATFGLLAAAPVSTAGAAPFPDATPQVVVSKGNGLIAFVSTRSGNADIFTMWWDGLHPINLTNNAASDSDPAWSPDGTHIAFTSDRSGNRDVWVMNADGSNPVNLTNNPATDSQPSWSPDGARIAFTTSRTGLTDIWTMDANGANPTRVTQTTGPESDPAWAPNGATIAYTFTKAGNTDVWSIKPDGTIPRNLTKNPASDSQPAWTPDSKLIAFTTDRAGNQEIYRMTAAGKNVLRLTTNNAPDTQPAYSPDHGTKLLFTTTRTGNSEVFYERALNGTSAWTISHDPSTDSQADWQPLPAFPASATPIEHVVIIYMENQSFDSVFAHLCVEDDRCDGQLTGELFDGTVIPLPAAQDVVPNSPHSYTAQQASINGGLMNGFSKLQYCQPPGYTCYQAYTPEQIPTISSLARSFAISDRTFELDTVGSFGSHLGLASTILSGFYTGNHGEGPERGPGSGCDSGGIAAWQPNAFDGDSNQPSCIPFADGTGNGDPTDVHWVSTIMDRMDEAGIPWKIYGTIVPGTGNGYGWAICPTFADCFYTQQHDQLVDRLTFPTDALAGNLPAFSILTPDPPNSQHNSRSMMQGDNWIAEQVGAIMNGPDWDSTAVFITWDDCGCFYDHVPPPTNLGIREPFLIVSPYARPGFTDSNVASFASMLTFAEKTFGLAPLSNVDAESYAFDDAFDFSQEPLRPIPLPAARGAGGVDPLASRTTP